MSVTTQQQYQSLQGTTVYVVDPELLRQKVILKSFQLSSKASPKNGIIAKCENETPSKSGLGQVFYEGRKPRRRRLESDEGAYEEEEEVLYSKVLGKEVTTRAGRVSKTNNNKQATTTTTTAAAATAAKIVKTTAPEVPPPGQRVKKREPASVFRCPTCQKVYIGYSKLKLHFRKFPDHYSYGEGGSGKQCPTLRKECEVISQSSIETQTDLLGEKVDIAIQTQASNLTSSSSPHNKDSSTGLHNNSNNIQNFSFQSVLTQPESSLNMSQFYGQTSPPPARSGHSFGSFSPYKSLTTEFSKHLNGSGESPLSNSSSSSCPENVFQQQTSPAAGAPTPPFTNSVLAPNGKVASVPISPVSKIPSSYHNSLNGHSTSEQSQSPGSSLQRLIWDVVEEKMIQHGINEILNELSDVADKLAKIARDKIIPIREEEEEQLRANNTAPIVQVDTPFLSHLLDLPFGTYMFKEDAGIRRLPPPPVAADLSLNSLTSGVEVDIDKFLPSMDLLHLPHLTNIDFSTIYNDS